MATVQLVLVRTGIEYEIKRRGHAEDHPDDPQGNQGALAEVVHRFPVMLLALYSNEPNLFAENLPDFRDLLNRVRIGTESGFSGQSEASAKPAAAPVSQPGVFDPNYGAPVGPAPPAPAPPAPAPPVPAPEEAAVPGPNGDSLTAPASDAAEPPATQ